MLMGCYSQGLTYAQSNSVPPTTTTTTTTLHLLKQDSVVIFTLTAISS